MLRASWASLLAISRGDHGWRFTARMQVASRDEKISLSESNTILQQATIDPEQAKNYLGFLDPEMIIARDPLQGFSWEFVRMKLRHVSLDPESITSGKILWPENETGQGFRKKFKFLKNVETDWKINVFQWFCVVRGEL